MAHATWFGATGQVISSASAGAQARQQLQLISSVTASRSRTIAPPLLADLGLVACCSRRRSGPGIRRSLRRALTVGYGGEMRLNHWQTRYVSSVTGLDGRGLRIMPGARGLCINDP